MALGDLLGLHTGNPSLPQSHHWATICNKLEFIVKHRFGITKKYFLENRGVHIKLVEMLTSDEMELLSCDRNRNINRLMRLCPGLEVDESSHGLKRAVLSCSLMVLQKTTFVLLREAAGFMPEKPEPQPEPVPVPVPVPLLKILRLLLRKLKQQCCQMKKKNTLNCCVKLYRY